MPQRHRYTLSCASDSVHQTARCPVGAHGGSVCQKSVLRAAIINRVQVGVKIRVGVDSVRVSLTWPCLYLFSAGLSIASTFFFCHFEFGSTVLLRVTFEQGCRFLTDMVKTYGLNRHAKNRFLAPKYQKHQKHAGILPKTG